MAGRRTTINDLPDELLLEIFSYVSSSEITHVIQEVCTRWKSLAHDPHLWHNQRYIFRKGTSEEEAVATFAARPHLRVLILEEEVTPRVFDALYRMCPNLVYLETEEKQDMNASEMYKISKGCKRIRTLKVCDSGLRAEACFLDAVAQLADLRVLHLRETYFHTTVVSLRVLADGCPHLYDLDMGQARGLKYRMADAEYFLNTHKRVLKRLRIWSTSVEKRSIAILLPRVETLQDLQLVHYGNRCPKDAAEAVTALWHLHNLQKLHFGVNKAELRHLVPDVFRNGGMPHLQQLTLEYCMADETTRALAENCPELRELVLWKCEGHTDALLEPLCQLKKLEKLKINHCKCLGGKAMSFIAKVPALRILEFARIEFDQLKPSLHCILEMSGLQRLYFDTSNCYDIPFDKFPGKMVNLRELEINFCGGDYKAVNRLCVQMPDLKVVGNFGGAVETTSDEENYGVYFRDDDYV